MNKWRSTQYPGIRFYYHKTRKHGIKFDQYFSIRYQRDGKRVEEGLGWASEGMTLEKAVKELGDLKEALTFGEFFEKTYYPIAKRSKKPMSHLTEWGHFKNWIQPAIGEIPLKDLRPLHLERLKKTLLEAEKIDKDAPTKTVKNPKSPRTIQYIFATIRGAWNMARKHRVIEGDSPTKAVKKPKVENKRVRFLTSEEAQTLLEELESLALATCRMAAISLFTGLRAGEVFNLKWKNLDQGNGLVWVMDSKSGKSRAVYPPDQVKDLFEEMTAGKPEDLIFPGPGREVFPQIPRHFSFNPGLTFTPSRKSWVMGPLP